MVLTSTGFVSCVRWALSRGNLPGSQLSSATSTLSAGFPRQADGFDRHEHCFVAVAHSAAWPDPN